MSLFEAAVFQGKAVVISQSEENKHSDLFRLVSAFIWKQLKVHVTLIKSKFARTWVFLKFTESSEEKEKIELQLSKKKLHCRPMILHYDLTARFWINRLHNFFSNYIFQPDSILIIFIILGLTGSVGMQATRFPLTGYEITFSLIVNFSLTINFVILIFV